MSFWILQHHHWLDHVGSVSALPGGHVQPQRWLHDFRSLPYLLGWDVHQRQWVVVLPIVRERVLEQCGWVSVCFIVY
jgi:hypothetical protein